MGFEVESKRESSYAAAGEMSHVVSTESVRVIDTLPISKIHGQSRNGYQAAVLPDRNSSVSRHVALLSYRTVGWLQAWNVGLCRAVAVLQAGEPVSVGRGRTGRQGTGERVAIGNRD